MRFILKELHQKWRCVRISGKTCLNVAAGVKTRFYFSYCYSPPPPFIPNCAGTMRVSNLRDFSSRRARRRSARDGERSRSAPERTTHFPAPRAFPALVGVSRGPGAQTEVLHQRAGTARSCGSHGEHEQPHVAAQRHAGPPEGAPVQGAGDRGPGSREDLHHQALRAPDLLQQLPGHHRSGLRLEGAELGF